MKRGLPAVSAALAALMLAGCMTAAPGNSTATAALAPPVPKDERSHGTFEQMTGINGDAVSAISGDIRRAYIYFDFFAADKTAVKAAPAKLCAHYGKGLKSSFVTEPGDREPGIKVLVVDCAG